VRRASFWIASWFFVEFSPRGRGGEERDDGMLTGGRDGSRGGYRCIPPQNGTQMPKLGHDCCQHSDEWTIVREGRRTLVGLALYATVF